MKISLIQPARNNLKYLKWSYDSIRKNQGNHIVEICVADDASSDGTWEWCQERMKEDENFRAIRNEGPERLGHTILYDRLVNEVATHDICMIYHADMYLCPGALSAIARHMYTPYHTDHIEGGFGYSPNKKKIVSLTRIEPPLHPDGPEKILSQHGVEPEEFTEEALLEEVKNLKEQYRDKTTEGIFAPWAFWKEDFQEIGGHDPLYAPQSKEDSDIFNRFLLNGVSFVQTWEGYVYHMTCRGSRRNVLDKAKNIYEDSPEWLAQNKRSTRNFIRKWGHFVKHDALMKPIVPARYNIGIVVHSCTDGLLQVLEPWSDSIYTDIDTTNYWISEKDNTIYDLKSKLRHIEDEVTEDVVIYINSKSFTQQDMQYIQEMNTILQANKPDPGKFKVGNLNIQVNRLEDTKNELIKL